MSYTTVSGDSWDIIARAVYGRELLADRLMQARENITLLDIEIFPAGVTVFVPELTVSERREADLPAWRKG